MVAPTVLVIYGTRPEVIKLAPVVWALRGRNVQVSTCSTGQHHELIAPLLEWFGIVSDYDLGLMRPGQSLADLTASALRAVSALIDRIKPNLIVVQGDTTTAFAGALAGFLGQVPIAHVEAGLRTDNPLDPFPEEANRRMISAVASYHFVPTNSSREQLLREGINSSGIFHSGNTVIDTLLWTVGHLHAQPFPTVYRRSSSSDRVILVTAHRRESFGAPLERICQAIRSIAERNQGIQIVFPVHPNPNVKEVVHRMLGGVERVTLLEPLEYPSLVQIMADSWLVLTDSGGLQEEAPALGKPVLILRETTERPEAVEIGAAQLVGTQVNAIREAVESLLQHEDAYSSMAQFRFPFGDGHAADRIGEVITNLLTLSSRA